MDTQVASNNQKRKNKFFIKLLCFVVTIVLLIGIDFIVANIVHKTGDLPASVEIKNGLSAYELAVEQGYNGNLEAWLKSLDGKSAYEIAVENGYTGTEAEWNKAVANVSNQNSITITNAECSSNGELMITLSDGTVINVGKVAGSDGKDGANGKNGTDGKNGVDGVNGTNGIDGKDGINGTNGVDGKNGKDGVNGTNGADGKDGKDGVNGTNGADGKDGQDGIGISAANVNEAGQLILTFSDGTAVNLDKVVGTNGKDGRDGIDGAKGDKGDKGADGKDGRDGIDGVNGTDGVDGKDGIGISSIVITDEGNLDIALSNGTTLNLGTIKGADGKDGRDGRNGIDGINGTNGVNGKDGQDGINGTNGADGKDGQDGIGISNVNINAEGELVLTFSDNQTINLGRIVGKDGKDGTNGIDGINGKDGADGAKGEKGDKGDMGEKGEDGKDGINGTDGKDGTNGVNGKDGIGIKNVTVSDDGTLTVILDNDTVLNLGNIKGANGKDGADGKNGADGAPGKDGDDGLSAYEIAKKYGKTNAASEEEWLEEFKKELKGEKGDTGAQGEKGENGRGIDHTDIEGTKWIIYYTDETTEEYDLSEILGSSGNGVWVTTQTPTCTSKGTEQRISADGTTETRDILPLPHNYGEDRRCIDCGLRYSTDITYKLSADKTYYIVTGGSKSATSIVIPDYYNEKPVKMIADSAFSSYTGLSAVTIPITVERIGASAFERCTALKSITIPDSVIVLGENCFSRCSNLETVTLSNRLKAIYLMAFASTGLKEITIPKSVKLISDQVFQSCSALTKVTFEDPSGLWAKSSSSSLILSVDDPEANASTLRASGCEGWERID